MGMSDLEAEFAFQLKAAGLPEPEREYHAIDGRRFRWDFAYPTHRLLIEIQGGTWHKGGHSTGKGIARDCEKMDLAVLAGWRCLAFTAEMVHDGTALNMVEEAIGHGH